MDLNSIAATELAALQVAQAKLDAATQELERAHATVETREAAVHAAQSAFDATGSEADASALEDARAESTRARLWVERARRLESDAGAARVAAHTVWSEARTSGLVDELYRADIAPLVASWKRSIEMRLDTWAQAQALGGHQSAAWAALCEITNKDWRNSRGLSQPSDAALMTRALREAERQTTIQAAQDRRLFVQRLIGTGL